MFEDVCKGGGRGLWPDVDKNGQGEGGVKFPDLCGRPLWMTPLWMTLFMFHIMYNGPLSCQSALLNVLILMSVFGLIFLFLLHVCLSCFSDSFVLAHYLVSVFICVKASRSVCGCIFGKLLLL